MSYTPKYSTSPHFCDGLKEVEPPQDFYSGKSHTDKIIGRIDANKNDAGRSLAISSSRPFDSRLTDLPTEALQKPAHGRCRIVRRKPSEVAQRCFSRYGVAHLAGD